MKKKFDVEGFEKLKAAFDEYEAKQKERFKNFSVGLLKSSKVPQEANVPGTGWVKFELLTHNELSDLAKFYKDDQREFELQALLNVAQDILKIAGLLNRYGTFQVARSNWN